MHERRVDAEASALDGGAPRLSRGEVLGTLGTAPLGAVCLCGGRLRLRFRAARPLADGAPDDVAEGAGDEREGREVQVEGFPVDPLALGEEVRLHQLLGGGVG